MKFKQGDKVRSNPARKGDLSTCMGIVEGHEMIYEITSAGEDHCQICNDWFTWTCREEYLILDEELILEL